jgi:hypothetical protein
VREFVLVVESDPNLAPPGIRRRYEHVTSWLQEHGVHFRTVTLLPRPDLGRWARLVGVVGARKRILTDLSPDATIMVLGLGAPHMLMAAHSCLGAGRSVVYDVCDSWLLQFKARMWSGKLVRVLPSLLGVSFQLSSRRPLHRSYISNRDLQTDARLNWGRASCFVIPPVAGSELHRIEPMDAGKVQRIALSADFRSFHIQAGLKALLNVWPAFHEVHPDVALHLFGVGSPPQEGSSGVMTRGFANHITDLYVGNTLVFVANVGGGGVPNKLLEAVAAQRPVIVHESLLPLLEPHEWIFSYSTEASLLAALQRVAQTTFGQSSVRMKMMIDDGPAMPMTLVCS